MIRGLTVSLAMGIVLTAPGCARQPRIGSSVPRTPVVIRISDFKFTPAEIVVSARDSIVWINDDAFAHTTTSDNNIWTSGELARNGRYALVAPAPGRYTYHCAAHPTMTAVLEVRLEE